MAKLSIVTTLYRSSPFIEEFYQRVSATAAMITDDFEIVLVNDGSPDDVLAVVLALSDKDSKLKIVDLSRNFGHHKAVMAGLAHCCGEQVFLIDCDLEEPPECLAEFYAEHQQSQGMFDSIYGVQAKRKGNWLSRTGGRLFYAFLNRYSGLSMNDNPLTVRLMNRRYVNAVLLHCEEGLYLAGIFEITGFTQKSITIDKNHKGQTSYTFGHKISLLIKGITAFSSFPLKLVFYCGFFIAFFSFGVGFYLTIRKLIYNAAIDVGWTSIMVSIWFIGGLLLVGMGTTGIYISKVYSEVKRRPNYIVKKVYQRD